ncbi:LuxR C-terminal-related transcriptional regulator [Clostridium sp.]|uniref:LuxR C-terminal-related transcriptional regulator n=1 Tax=Clostridium sp. TaxID=1506 RepID=UPI0025B8815F|nr:LuxR C-terminal-related transcriptional regulator [Clostridium sp.]
MRQYILKREHIRTEFKNIFEYPLTLAVAAMGYGKTTSARDFLSDGITKYIWLTVDSDESSPQFIWDSFTGQLTKTNPETGKQLRALGFPTDVPQRDKVLKIIEHLTYMTNTVLVIDDYHYAHSQELDKLIERIVRANIKGFHILMLSRTIPEMKIDELGLKGYCYLIKSNLFEVNKSEIKEFFKLYHHSISDNIAKQIYDLSEGWVSAIYLIMQSYDEIGKLETGRSIEKLIETAVMKRYSKREVLLLKSLCILDSFTPQQAGFVTGDPDAEKIIRKISYENSFIRYDKREDMYRIHNIFNSYLKNSLKVQESEINLTILYKRAGDWCSNNGDIITGLKYYMKAKEYDFILSEFEKGSINQVIDSNPKYILELFEQIPDEVKYSHAIGYLAFTGFYVTNVNIEIGSHLLSEIERYYQMDCKSSPAIINRICGEIELIKSYISFNDATLMREKLIKAHKMLDGHSLIANKDKIITFGSPHALYLYYRKEANLLQTIACVQDMFHYYTDLAGGCGKGFDDLLQAEYFLEMGDLDNAELNAYKAIYKAKTMNQVAVILCSKFALARIASAQGKFTEALEIMNELSTEVEQFSSPILNSAFDVCAGYIGGISENENGFPEWLGNGDIEQSETLYQGMGFNYIVYGKYILLKKEYIRLEVACEQMQQVFSMFNNILGYLHSHILSAIAAYKIHGMNEAKKALLLAIKIGHEDNIILPFAEYGIHILKILKELQKDNEKDAYLNLLVDYTAKYADNLNISKENECRIPVLTKREKEILRLIIEGKINREIASELFIAEVTVRKNITAIYRKLNVTGRSFAVKKCLEMKIM